MPYLVNLEGSPFTDDELEFLVKKRNRLLRYHYKWVARNKDGTLSFFMYKPRKTETKWYASLTSYQSEFKFTTKKYQHLFPTAKWEDEEPIEFWEYMTIEYEPRRF
jgi:hypothetical protein